MSQPEPENDIALTAVSVSGRDAAAFLQSQLTLDVESVPEDRLRPCAWCRPDGRADAVMLIGRCAGRWWLILPADIAAPVAKRLGMFSIGRQVELDADRAAVAGEGAGTMVLDYDADRAVGIVEPDAARPLPRDWIRRDIAHGMPWLFAETRGEFLPQMLGLEALGGLSYGKGCYPGQEVIARVHYRGRVTRRTACFRLPDAPPPAPGAAAEVDGDSGTVLYATEDADDRGAIGLVVAPAAAAATGAVEVGGSAGALVGG
jgi:hypothetical protein